MRAALLSLLLLPLLACGQSWCPPGARWTFGYIDQLFGSGIHRIELAGDTLIDGHQAQRLEHWVRFGGGWGQPEWQTVRWPDLHTYEENGVVFLKSDWSLDFDTVMWFSAAPGDRWTIPGMDDWGFVVLDTSTIALDGMALKQLIVQVEPEGWFMVDTLRERIGYKWFFIDPAESMVIDGNYDGLRCYEDESISFSAPWVSDCGFTMSVHPSELGKVALPIPNPGTIHFTLDLPSGPHIITLIDATGRMVLQERTSEARPEIATEALPAGLYRIAVRDERGAVMGATWVKE